MSDAAARCLTPEIMTRALDELWRKPVPRSLAEVVNSWKYLDWTVQADGYRLVIKDGAIAGLACDEFPWPWGDPRYDEVTVVDSWSGWMAAGPYILGRDWL